MYNDNDNDMYDNNNNNSNKNQLDFLMLNLLIDDCSD